MPININGAAVGGGGVGNGRIVASGQIVVATAGVAVRLTTAAISCSVVWCGADIGNTLEGPVVVGGSGVIAASSGQTGIVLLPGNAPTAVEVSDLSELWVDSMTNGEMLWFVAIG